MSDNQSAQSAQKPIEDLFLNKKFQDELKIRLKASGVFFVETSDRMRFQTDVALVCEEMNFHNFEWNADQGMRHISADHVTLLDQKETRKPTEVFRWIMDRLKQPPETPGATNSVYVFRNFDRYFKSAPPIAGVIIEACINCINVFKSVTNSFVFYGPSMDIPNEMSEDVTRIKYERPDKEALKATFEWVHEGVKQTQSGLEHLDDETVDMAVKAALGQSANKAEESFAMGWVKNGFAFDKNYCRLVKAETMARIREEGLVKVIEPRGGFNETFAGYEHIPQMFRDDLATFSPEARAAGVDKADGALVGSPAGFGKGVLVKALAYEFNMPLLSIDSSCIKDKYYGESERKLTKILRLGREQFGEQPSILNVDEAEKTLGSMAKGGEDSTSGTGQSMLGMILTWLQDRKLDPKDNVYVIMSFNDGNRLPDALIRPGRFGTRIWLDLPTADDRFAIFRLHLERRFRDIANFNMDEIVGNTANFSGAEIEGTIVTMTKKAFSQSRMDEQDLLMESIHAVAPAAADENSEYARQSKWARLRRFGAQAGTYSHEVKEEKEVQGRRLLSDSSIAETKKKKEVKDD